MFGKASMGFMQSHKYFAVFLALVLLPLSIRCVDISIHYSNATFFTDPAKTPNGGCGYGEYGRKVNNGLVAVASSAKVYDGSIGCGACYQVKCKKVECNTNGVVVVVTDYVGGGNDTDLVLSTDSYRRMAKAGTENALIAYGKVDIQYQRVSCQYPGKSLMLKVLDDSHYNSDLTLQFLYQGGQSDITGVQVFDDENLEWMQMTRAYGAVWELKNPPAGSLTIRFFLDGKNNPKPRWVLMRNVLPAVWEAGEAYDTSIQLDP